MTNFMTTSITNQKKPSKFVPTTGVEPVACGLGNRRSILLSYEGVTASRFYRDLRGSVKNFVSISY